MSAFNARFAACLAVAMSAVLGACDQSGGVNPPTQPAQPIQGPAAAAPPAQKPAGTESMLPGAGPPSFMGRWAAKAEWCGGVAGEAQPIEITTTEFRGYENRCSIERIHERSNAYEAALSCEGEGVRTSERVRLVATSETLTLTWLDRAADQPVRLIRCTSLAG